jgi:magnesium chelatase family protein
MSRGEPGEASAQIRQRVIAARAVQQTRLAGSARCNARMHSREIRKHCALNPECAALLQSAVQALHLSARAYDRILKVARTVADLAQATNIEPEHLQEAIGYRTLDREIWK